MTLRFDHAIIAVRDLDRAVEQFTRLGFQVQRGGRHSVGGTHNALVRFGVDYLELMAIFDPRAAEANPPARVLLEFLRAHEGGLVGYAIATDDIEWATAQLSAYAPVGPMAMGRKRPDGRDLSWRLTFPGGMPWQRPWPFLIQWDQDDATRLAWDGVVLHPNGATRVVGLAVAARDPAQAAALYADALGFAPSTAGRSFALGDFTVSLEAAPATGAEGPRSVELRVESLDRARAYLRDAGISFQEDARGLAIAPEEACGAHMVLVADR